MIRRTFFVAGTALFVMRAVWTPGAESPGESFAASRSWAEWRAVPTPRRDEVMREGGTEPAGTRHRMNGASLALRAD